MAPVNEQITTMERCERAVENVLSRMQQPCLLEAPMIDEAPEQLDVESDPATTRHPLRRAA